MSELITVLLLKPSLSPLLLVIEILYFKNYVIQFQILLKAYQFNGQDLNFWTLLKISLQKVLLLDFESLKNIPHFNSPRFLRFIQSL